MVPVRDVEIVKYLYPTYHGNSLDLKNFLKKLEPKIFNRPKVTNFFVYLIIKLRQLTDIRHAIFTIKNTEINLIVFISFAHR